MYESWETISFICIGLLTSDILYEKIDDLSASIKAIMSSIPKSERLYLLEKEKHKKEEANENKYPG